MRKHAIKCTAAIVLAAIVLYGAAAPYPVDDAAAASLQSSTGTPVLEEAQQYVDELSKQSPFDAWKGAKLDISPLGPGTHSWLVIVKQSDVSVGYLVIQAKEDGGYKLGEYGFGSRPIFSPQSLSFSVKQLGQTRSKKVVEPLYSHPLLTAWKITVGGESAIADAASGELLPVSPANWLKAAAARPVADQQAGANPQANVRQSVQLSSFSPYGTMPWLTEQPFLRDTDSTAKLLTSIGKKEQLRYTAELFSGQMLYVWSVVGFAKWDGSQVYVALEDQEDGEIRRYIPLSLLKELGHFYR